MRGKKLRIGGNAIAFSHDQDIARNNLTPRYAALSAVSDHKRARAGKIAQALEHALGLQVLVHDYSEIDKGQNRQERSLLQIPDHEIERRRPDEQKEQWLPQGFEQNAPEIAAVSSCELIWTDSPQKLNSFLSRQTFIGRIGHGALPYDRSPRIS
jgi:hypothetical protein